MIKLFLFLFIVLFDIGIVEAKNNNVDQIILHSGQYNTAENLIISSDKEENQGNDFFDYLVLDEEKDNSNVVMLANDDPEGLGMPFCEQEEVLKTFKILGYFVFALKIIVPLVLILLAIKDLSVAVISSDDKANETAVGGLVSRIALGIAIFFLPTIINFFLGLIESAVKTKNKFSKCTECLLAPSKCAYQDDMDKGGNK